MAVHQEKIMRRPENEKVDSAVYTWFLQKHSQGQQILGSILCKKEWMFNETMRADSMFRPSLSWLRNFCQEWNL